MKIEKLMKVATGAALALGLFAPGARAGSSSVVWVDTRAFVLAPELLEDAATCEVMSGADCAYLTTTLSKDLSPAGTYTVTDNLGPVEVNVNGKTWTGAPGANGSATTDGGTGSPVFKVGTNTTIKVSGTSGGIVGGAGAEAFVDSSGNKFAVSGATSLVLKGKDGQVVKTQEHKDIEDAFGDDVVVTPMTDDDGHVTNYLVTVTNDLTGPVILPESVTDVVIKLDNHSITGLVGEAGTEGVPGGAGTPAIVVSNAEAQVSIVGPGTVTGGNGGAGNPPGAGAPAVADADGKPVEPAVSGDASVSSGAAGEDLKPAIEAVAVNVTAIAVDDEGPVTLTAEVTFKADITPGAFATWAEDNLKVKSSDVLTGLDEAVAAKPVSVGEAVCVGKTATADLTVEKPSEDAGFYRVVIP